MLIISTPVFAGGGHDHGHDDHADDDHETKDKGPNGGVLLSKGSFELEVTIFEDGVPPRYRIYAYNDKKSLAPSDVKAKIILKRFLRDPQTYELQPEENYLTSVVEISEPHSFEISVQAEYEGQKYAWNYESHEGRVELSNSSLEVADLGIETAAAAKIHNTTEVFGRLLPNEDKVAHVYPRFSGVIKEIRKKLGDPVGKGDVLAIVESNQSLQTYEIQSLISGTIIKRHATLGEFVPEAKELFIIADLSEIWADFQVYRDDFPAITPEQEVSIQLNENETPIKARVSYVSPLTDIVTQSKLIRAVISNTDQRLRPGLFISGILSSSSSPAAVTVKRDAIQRFRDWDVVFITEGNTFQAMPVKLGKQDRDNVEVLSGVNLGDRYVNKNSFIIKAEIEKSGASHDH